MSEITLTVDGYPPAKGDALDARRRALARTPGVTRLLEGAREAASGSALTGLESQPIGLEVVLRCPRNRKHSDATIYLGGIGDALERKQHRGQIEHLGDP